jgi:hypothetical protein
MSDTNKILKFLKINDYPPEEILPNAVYMHLNSNTKKVKMYISNSEGTELYSLENSGVDAAMLYMMSNSGAGSATTITENQEPVSDGKAAMMFLTRYGVTQAISQT